MLLCSMGANHGAIRTLAALAFGSKLPGWLANLYTQFDDTQALFNVPGHPINIPIVATPA